MLLPHVVLYSSSVARCRVVLPTPPLYREVRSSIARCATCCSKGAGKPRPRLHLSSRKPGAH
eukprot:scaffold56577_cov37-Tisochrysis_lutea.AAC.7